MNLPVGYELDSSRGGGVVFAHAEDGTRVVVKELALGRVSSWKELELFEREVATLRQLKHPSIPALIDDVRGDGDIPAYYLIAEWVEGESLESLADTMDEERLKSITRKLLGVLVHLQDFSPPVLHRNITPEAVIVGPDDHVSLVDFGSVQVELQATVGGSTVVGTSGYMAPEQLLGRARPSSDLYSLGATLVRVITGIEPSELPLERMSLRWRDRARFGGERLLDWVDRLVSPEAAGRFERASDALRALGGDTMLPAVRGEDLPSQRSVDSRVELIRRSGTLMLKIPIDRRRERLLSVLLSILIVAALVGYFFSPITYLAAVAVAVGTLIVGLDIVQNRCPAELELDAGRGFRLQASRTGRLQVGSMDDFVGLEIGFGGQRDSLWVVTRTEMIHVSRGGTPGELDWICDEADAFLREEKIRSPRRNVDEWLQQKLSAL